MSAKAEAGREEPRGNGVGARLEGKRICICAGSGGVGKTTTSAALALGLMRRGQRVAVVTIDPARRLATSLGVEELSNEPHLLAPELIAAAGIEPLVEGGELWAMTLDAKRTFDELIARLAPDSRTFEEVRDNRIYQQLSSAVAGSQEFTAIAKLYELDREARFDTIVLDTPPSRNALDFLDAPKRLTQFLEGRALRMMLRPTGLASRLVGRGTGVVFTVLARVTGANLLDDLSGFFRALAGLLDGFRERARSVDALLRDPATTFLLVSSPERDPSEEAIFFRQKLREAGMPFGGLIVNRVHRDALGNGHTPDEVAAMLEQALGDRLAGRVATAAAEWQLLSERDRHGIDRLCAQVGERQPLLVPELERDVSDLEGLAAIERQLFRERGGGVR